VTYRPLTAAEKTQINDLAMQAMGFNKERGDALTVVNTPFAVEAAEKLPEVPLWQNPEAIEYAKDALRFLAGVIVLMLIYKKAMKPMLEKLTAVPAPPQLGVDDGDGSVVRLSGESGIEGLGTQAGLEGEMRKIGAVAVNQNLEVAKQLAKDNPRIVANVVSSWTNGNPS
jgi:flagellar M-ring protein FliF